MRCQYHSNKPCNDCDENLISCNDCEYIDCEGDCDNSDSKNYGKCMDGLVVCCCLFEKKMLNNTEYE